MESVSEAGKSRTSVDEQAGYPPGSGETGASKEGGSSGSALWGELERAWNIGPETGEEERNLEKLRAKHCKERKKGVKVEERRASRPDLGCPFKTQDTHWRKGHPDGGSFALWQYERRRHS